MKKKKKAALIGYGFIASKGHLPAFLEMPEVEVVALSDICSERRAIAKSKYPKLRIYDDHESLLDQEKELDFVDIATPPSSHREITLNALLKGLHVLCEKPLAISTKEAKEMILMAKERGRVLFPCHNYKHAPVVQEIQKHIHKGSIGDITSLTLQTFRYTHAKGVKEWKTDWRREKEYAGGGITMDHGPHSFYLMFDWFKGLPESVSAHMISGDPGWDTEDTLQCNLKFPHGLASAFLSWTAGARKMLYTVEGNKGALFVDNDNFSLVQREKEKENYTTSSQWMDASHVEWNRSLFQEFFRCIDAKEYIHQEILNAYLCLEIIEKCYLSHKNKSRFENIDKSFSFIKS